MKSEDKANILNIWSLLESNNKGYYKPSEITTKQQDLINDLIKYLSIRDASLIIALLYLLKERKD